jgi:hypothetical protein
MMVVVGWLSMLSVKNSKTRERGRDKERELSPSFLLFSLI